MPEKNIEQNINYGKSKQQITFDFLKWIIGLAFAVGAAYGILETKSHSEETYVRKDMYIEAQRTNDKAHDEMKSMLKEIRDGQNTHWKEKSK
jgi:hypothetical protein